MCVLEPNIYKIEVIYIIILAIRPFAKGQSSTYNIN